MGISRRTVLSSGVAAAGAGLAGAAVYSATASDAAVGPLASPAGDVVGKVTVGCQGWFGAKGDGSPANIWWHYDSNGQPATLFSSWTPQTVDTHVKWMQEYGIDTAALQRFSDILPFRNGVATNEDV